MYVTDHVENLQGRVFRYNIIYYNTYERVNAISDGARKYPNRNAKTM